MLTTKRSINNQTKRSTRFETRDTKLQQGKGTKTLRSKEAEANKKSPNTIAKHSYGFDDQDPGESKEADILDESSNGVQTDDESETIHVEENTHHEAKEAFDLKFAQMETRIEKLEEELREVAALEVSLYSVIQEHSSSAHKVHTPAHRLSRLYIHASKRLSIARNIVSGLNMIFMSCGNDVSRLTFWWSNIAVMREMITQAFENKQSNKSDFTNLVDDWQETRTFTSELEKIESGIFSRIIESIWCQTLKPKMLTNEANAKLPGDFSINLWQNAFHDAFKRLCPVRARGHECGCLPFLARMVMEQCVSILDVAMFNSVLHGEIQSDHVTDPIIDSRVLPIPTGDLSFSSGARLKKAVGNWSRWLTDRFSVETDSEETSNEDDDFKKTKTGELKCFNLLNSLSCVLMVPKDMLTDRSIRDELCPSISLSLLGQILRNFTPDEFCPDPVPNSVLEALNAESIIDRGSSEDDSSGVPYAAATIIYKPPPINVAERVCEAGGNTELNRKVYTSDEEVEELDSSPTFTIGKFPPFPTGEENGIARYQLLREVWSS
ncbi:unnamed protein product [Lactuca virosa]|uniref:Dilute domain-containing protein n=1 Tax=Lactuca virosa TaxID=75947 RepID=A0AAU9N2I6_9ASTR|nr:unnamed protein product [Lactuca virosa]